MYCEMCGDASGLEKYCESCQEEKERVRKEMGLCEINKSHHYNVGRFEAIEVIEDWDLNFNLGNALKYIARCNHKGNKIKDLEKALYYIRREIDNDN